MARPRQVRWVVRTTVLFGKDVVEMKRPERQMALVQVAVFAITAGAMTDKLAKARGITQRDAQPSSDGLSLATGPPGRQPPQRVDIPPVPRA